MFVVITPDTFAVYETQPLNCVAHGSATWEVHGPLGSVVLRGSGDFPLSKELEREIVQCWYEHYVSSDGADPVHTFSKYTRSTPPDGMH